MLALRAIMSNEKEIRASHLLIKHTCSRRPSSWKQPVITRSPQEAMAIIQSHRQGITSGETTLEALATSESDCGSAQRGGDLGFFTRGQMQKAFEDAAFSLQVGELSGVVSSDSGFHLILRTG